MATSQRLSRGFHRLALKASGVALVVALVAPLAGQAKVIKAMGGGGNFVVREMLGCFINNAHRVEVGSARHGVFKGTLITFTARLDYPPYQLYTATVPLAEDVPRHLFGPLTVYQFTPKFSIAHGCEAWWTPRPEVAPPR